MTEAMPALSVVIPLYNEAEGLFELYDALALVLQPYGDRCEIVFVDDGSIDGSFDRLGSLRQCDRRITVVKLRGRQGKAAALAAGFRLACGEVVVTMDADLQDDPQEIPRLIEKLQEGFDLVSGWKVRRQDPLSRRLLSALFNRVTARLTGVDLHDFNCGFNPEYCS